MKKILVCSLCTILIALCFTSCADKNKYIPSGEFYVKTPPARGDAGASEVISLEADKAIYEGNTDIIVPMTVGFGHLPGSGDRQDNAIDTFYIQYAITETPAVPGSTPVWEKTVEYDDSRYDPKYDTTEPKNRSFLFIPHYGDFYPLHYEPIEITFPADIKNGYLTVRMFTVTEGRENQQFAELRVFFEKADGVLTLRSR